MSERRRQQMMQIRRRRILAWATKPFRDDPDLKMSKEELNEALEQDEDSLAEILEEEED